MTVKSSGNMSWTGLEGTPDTLIIWDGRYVPVSQLVPGDEFKLFGWRWRVRRQAGRTTFADGTSEWEGCSIQLKHSRQVEVPWVVYAEPNTGSEPK